MRNSLENIFTKPSGADFCEVFAERWKHFRKHPFKGLFKLLFIAYLLIQLWPFIIDPLYCAVLILTFLPFIILKVLWRDAQKEITLTLLTVTLVYSWVTKPLFFPTTPSVWFNERFFKFENYKFRLDIHASIPKIIPIGTPKEKVEEILVKRGGAKEDGLRTTKSEFCYIYKIYEETPFYWEWHVRGDYDSSNRVREIYAWSEAFPEPL